MASVVSMILPVLLLVAAPAIAEGESIKCYVCNNCTEPINLMICPSASTLCEKTVYTNGRIDRSCSTHNTTECTTVNRRARSILSDLLEIAKFCYSISNGANHVLSMPFLIIGISLMVSKNLL
uniref:uncharacterized protein LOC120329251 n=1 Tax=Styela clava TaxID=7725 RepID=UPI00193A535F|nr:uncharacterized protein LOC120329251 [Styela clava]